MFNNRAILCQAQTLHVLTTDGPKETQRRSLLHNRTGLSIASEAAVSLSLNFDDRCSAIIYLKVRFAFVS